MAASILAFPTAQKIYNGIIQKSFKREKGNSSIPGHHAARRAFQLLPDETRSYDMQMPSLDRQVGDQTNS